MICDALTFIERIRVEGAKLSEATKLQIEFLIRNGCKHLNNLEKDYNTFLIKEDQRRRAINDPSRNEEDRKRGEDR